MLRGVVGAVVLGRRVSGVPMQVRGREVAIVVIVMVMGDRSDDVSGVGVVVVVVRRAGGGVAVGRRARC